MNTNNVISGIAAEDLSGKEHLSVKLTSTGLALAGAGDLVIGTILRGAVATKAVDIFLSGCFNGLHFITVGNNTAIAIGDLLEQVAGGKFVGRYERDVTIEADDDVVTSAAHGLVDGQKVVFTALTGGTGLTTTVEYFVRDAATDTFKVAASLGGAAINVSADATAGKVRPAGYSAIAWEAAPSTSSGGQIRALVL
jgi:hypothetical protein